ncbi:hypothetical protein M2G92_20815 [Vibrio vulnificus]|nr:hypothetical protein [Vibrio vulnificus]
MVKLSCGHFCFACLRPLTRRYNTKSGYCSKRLVELLFVH